MENTIDNRCPYCGGKLVEDLETATFSCPNPLCIKVMKDRIKKLKTEEDEFILDFTIDGLEIEIQKLYKLKEEKTGYIWSFILLVVILFFDYKFLTYGIPNNKGETLFLVIWSLVLLILTLILINIFKEQMGIRKYYQNQIDVLAEKKKHISYDLAKTRSTKP